MGVERENGEATATNPAKTVAPPVANQRVCMYCRAVVLPVNRTYCIPCGEKLAIARLDALTEKAAMECLGHLSRLVAQEDHTPETAAALAWDIGIAFAKEAVTRSKPK